MEMRTTALDIYEEALGQTPAQLVTAGRTLAAPDLAAVMSMRGSIRTSPSNPHVVGQLWPLVSHHTYGDRALFGGVRRDILPRALTLLLLHDGLVVADPLETVHHTLVTRTEDEAVVAFNRATQDLADVEPLIAAGVLRLTAVRPALRDSLRTAVLNSLGVGPDLRVFTDFMEAAGSVAALPGSLQRTFSPQVLELYRLFGLTIPAPSDLSSAQHRVRALAASVIEVSWQFAVAAIDPACDLAFRGRIESHLAQSLVDEGLRASLGPGRHLSALELGKVPNLDSTRLTLADALAVRQEDAFEGFRHSVRLALDQLEAARRAGTPEAFAQGAFEERMREESRNLRHKAKRATFSDRIKEASIPAALGVVTELAVATAGPIPAAGAFGAISLTTVLWQWLLGRQDDRGQVSRQRYLSMLGGDSSGREAGR